MFSLKVGDTILICGGKKGGGSVTRRCWQMDGEGRRFVSTASMIRARSNADSIRLVSCHHQSYLTLRPSRQSDGRVVVTGGAGSQNLHDDIEVLEDSSWSLLSASLPAGLSGHCILPGSNNIIYMTGGLTLDQDNNEALTSNISQLDMNDNSVQIRGWGLDVARSDHGCIR